MSSLSAFKNPADSDRSFSRNQLGITGKKKAQGGTAEPSATVGVKARGRAPNIPNVGHRTGVTGSIFDEFLKQGGTLASRKADEGKIQSPKAAGFPTFRGKLAIGQESVTNISDSGIQKLLNIFRRREEQIETVRKRPGVTQTRLLGR